MPGPNGVDHPARLGFPLVRNHFQMMMFPHQVTLRFFGRKKTKCYEMVGGILFHHILTMIYVFTPCVGMNWPFYWMPGYGCSGYDLPGSCCAKYTPSVFAALIVQRCFSGSDVRRWLPASCNSIWSSRTSTKYINKIREKTLSIKRLRLVCCWLVFPPWSLHEFVQQLLRTCWRVLSTAVLRS